MCCCIGETVAGGLSLRVQQLEVTCETKTKDNVFVNVVVAVQYNVVRESIYDAFYKLTDSRAQITSFVYDEVRSTVPRMNLVRRGWLCVCVCVCGGAVGGWVATFWLYERACSALPALALQALSHDRPPPIGRRVCVQGGDCAGC